MQVWKTNNGTLEFIQKWKAATAVFQAIIDKETAMANFAKAVTDGEFEQSVLGSEKPVLVDFWAEWCGPCRMIAPSVEAVAEQFEGRAGFFKMNVDENMNVPQQYGIRGIPTLIVFKGGQEQERIVGAVTREAIAKVVEKYVEDTSTSASQTGT
jgi:thioredoxin 1